MSEAPPGDPCPPWPPGHRIGPFELRAPVWRGETAVVYAGWDCGLVRQVAVKEYLPRALARRSEAGTLEPLATAQAAPFERGLQAFVETARLLAHCEHPSLLRVHHLVQAHGTAYRVMPWHLGRRLDEVWHPGLGAPDETRLRRLLDDLLGALAEYHRVAGAHGGVRAAQVLLQADGRALLLGPRHDGHPSSDAPSPADDLHDLACLARMCIADAPPATFSPALRETLLAAASPRAQDRPRSVAQFRLWLRTGPPARPPETAPPPVFTPTSAPLPEPVVVRAAFAAAASAFAPGPASASPASTPVAMPPLADFAPPRPPGPQTPGPGPTAATAPDTAVAVTSGHWRWPRLLAPWAVSAVVAVVTAVSWQTWRDTQHALLLARAATLPDTPAPRPTPAAGTAQPAVLPAAPAPPAAASEAPATQEAAPPPAAALPEETVLEPAPAASAASTATPPAVLAAVPNPPAARPAAPRSTASAKSRKAAAPSPRQACGTRTEFALYRCMQQQCARPSLRSHPQCVRFRATDHPSD